MRIRRTLALGASMLVLLSACSTGGSSTTPTTAAASPIGAGAPTIKVGSDGFYEAKIMAEIYAQILEANGFTVDRTGIGIGARKVSAPALETAKIDLKPEYVGSGLAFYDPGKQTGDPAANRTALQTVLTGKGGGITVLDVSPAADNNAFVVRKDTADQLKLAKLSDVAPVQDQLKWGWATDCPTNPVCAKALQTAYSLAPKNVTALSACDQPMVDALLGKTIDVGELCSTQPDIVKNGWVTLADDKATQPADNIAPLVRNDYLAKVDKAAFSKLLNDVSAKMTTDELLKLNSQFVFDKKDIAVIAKTWLQANGFVK